MKIPSTFARLKGFRFPREVIAYAVWAYHRFALSTADVEDLLAERGVIVSREAVRLWINRFGRHFASCIRRDRPKPNDKWHMDEVVITIADKKFWLWRAIDANGDVLDILVQPRRNKKAARRFFSRLVKQYGDAPQHCAITLCANSRGKPWTESGFRASFRKQLKRLEERGLIGTGLTFHGLRHTVAVVLAEAGVSAEDIAALLGQRSSKMADHYAREADRSRRSRAAIKKFRPLDNAG